MSVFHCESERKYKRACACVRQFVCVYEVITWLLTHIARHKLQSTLPAKLNLHLCTHTHTHTHAYADNAKVNVARAKERQREGGSGSSLPKQV